MMKLFYRDLKGVVRPLPHPLFFDIKYNGRPAISVYAAQTDVRVRDNLYLIMRDSTCIQWNHMPQCWVLTTVPLD